MHIFRNKSCTHFFCMNKQKMCGTLFFLQLVYFGIFEGGSGWVRAKRICYTKRIFCNLPIWFCCLELWYLFDGLQIQACLDQHRVHCLRNQQMGPYLAVRSWKIFGNVFFKRESLSAWSDEKWTASEPPGRVLSLSLTHSVSQSVRNALAPHGNMHMVI